MARALKINEQFYGKDHIETGKTLANLGNAYGSLGNTEKRKELLLRAEEIDIINYGKNHPSTACTQSNLGVVYMVLGDLDRSSLYQ